MRRLNSSKLLIGIFLTVFLGMMFSVKYWWVDIARVRVNQTWKLTQKPLPPTDKTLDGTYLPAQPGSGYGGPLGFAIRGNKIIFEASSDVIIQNEMPGEYVFEVVGSTAEPMNEPPFNSSIALVLHGKNGLTLLVHPRASGHYQFLVMPSQLVQYTIGTIVEESERLDHCIGIGDLIKVSDTPSNEFRKFKMPTAYTCHEGISYEHKALSPAAKSVIEMIIELYSGGRPSDQR